MSRSEAFVPPSLAQHFEPPDEHVGCFGWVCGYSADAPFLNDAAERFTRQTLGQRAYAGRIALALLLDPSGAQIPPTAAPGVTHLPLRPGAREFRLLHAKLALLAFRHETQAQTWVLRLIVTTGNWTRQTLEESLDLAWRVELSSADLRERGDMVRQACANIRAAWDLLTWLRDRFDTRLLEVSPEAAGASETVVAWQRAEDWIGQACEVGRRTRPQVFDNRSASFLQQLPSLVRHHGSDIARNYIAVGSGFYEESSDDGAIPSVLQRIVETLQRSGHLTQRPKVDVFVNPKACQAVARAVPAFAEAGWIVRPAWQPAFLGAAARSLHAKFLFLANERDNSPYCNSAWLYLGSGNLTAPGFANPMSPHGGNLEVGVVLAPESLCWYATRGVEPDAVLTNLLPLQWEHDAMSAPEALEAGGTMPDPETTFVACPIAYLQWEPADEGGRLRADIESMNLVEILDADGQPCMREGTGAVLWRCQRPREVAVRFTAEGRPWTTMVPVVDELGRVAGTALPALGIEEAWAQLASFPMPPAEDELAPDGQGDDGSGGPGPGGGRTSTARYPVRQMMELIENIAAKQTEVAQADWPTWCTRLEQCLMQMKGSPVIEAFEQFRLNPLSPLWFVPFRPDFAATAATTEGAMYERALSRSEAAWNVAELRRMGGGTS